MEKSLDSGFQQPVILLTVDSGPAVQLQQHASNTKWFICQLYMITPY